MGLLHFLSKMIDPASRRGTLGEIQVRFAAWLMLDESVYFFINDVTLPTENGTTQIDHVVFSKFGIFVIETKNYSGAIYGTEEDRYWTQRLGRQSNRFLNPIRQNAAHVKQLIKALEVQPEEIHSIIAFTGEANIKTSVPDFVTTSGGAARHIKSFMKVVFSEDRVQELRSRLESRRLERGIETDREHVSSLARRSGRRPSKREDEAPQSDQSDDLLDMLFPEPDFPLFDDETPQPREVAPPPPPTTGAVSTCPRCSSPMVLRRTRKGENAGKQFWGCSTYPRCRGILPMTPE